MGSEAEPCHRLRQLLLLPLLLLLLLLLLSVSGVTNALIISDSSFTINEEEPAGTLVGNIKDLLRGKLGTEELQNCTIAPFLTNKKVHRLLRIRQNSGLLVTRSRLDRDQLCAATGLCCDKNMRKLRSGVAACQLHFFAQVFAGNRPPEMETIAVDLVDINDNKPSFRSSRFLVKFRETQSLDNSEMLDLATDADWGDNGVVNYELHDPSNHFQLRVSRDRLTNSISRLELVNKRVIDRERKSWFAMRLVALDGGGNATSAAINVTVEDENDCDPVFLNGSRIAVNVMEDAEPHRVLFSVKATDKDFSANGRVTYSLKSRTHDSSYRPSLFSVDRTSGAVSLNRALRYTVGERNSHDFIIFARDAGSPRRSASIFVEVMVQDVNNHRPVISLSSSDGSHSRAVQVRENQQHSHSSRIATIEVSDRDSCQPGSSISCSLRAGTDKFGIQYFAPVPEEQQVLYGLYAIGQFDREKQALYSVVINCTDCGGSSSKLEVPVEVLDTNDSPPEFAQPSFDFVVAENRGVGEAIGKVRARDADVAPNNVVNYRIEPPDFFEVAVRRTTGQLTANASFDRELQPLLEFKVVAFNTAEPRHSATATVRVRVRDVNDNSPTVSADTPHRVVIREDAKLRSEVARINATDRDEGVNSRLRFSIANDDSGRACKFSIDPQGRVSLNSRLDREKQAEYHLRVTISDSGHPTKSTIFHFSVEVSDVNDTPPRFIFPALSGNNQVNVSSSLPVNSIVAQIAARDEDSGQNGNLTFSMIPSRSDLKDADSSFFQLHALTGRLLLRRSLARVAERIFQLRVRVADQGQPSLHRDSVLKVRVVQPPASSNNAAGGRDPGRGGGGGARDRRLGVRQPDIPGIIVLLVAGLAILILLILILSIVFLITRRRSEAASFGEAADASVKDTNLNYNTMLVQGRTLQQQQQQQQQQHSYPAQSMQLSMSKNRRPKAIEKLEVSEAAEQMLGPDARRRIADSHLRQLQQQQQTPLYQNPLAAVPADSCTLRRHAPTTAAEAAAGCESPAAARPYKAAATPASAAATAASTAATAATSIAYTQLSSATQLRQSPHKPRLPFDHVSDV